jgi:hypothetical protein
MHRASRTFLLTASMLIGCHVYDAGKLEPVGGAQAGSMSMVPTDSGTRMDAMTGVIDGGGHEAGVCIKQPEESCNLIDDDCDGEIDEDTQTGCEQIIVNGVAECVDLSGEARCVLRRCLEGFSNCDGNPANGCEPYCMCHDCPLDDAGEPVFTGDDAGPQ